MSNPFATSLQFLPVPYIDQMATPSVLPPSVTCDNILPLNPPGFTCELWFKTSAPGTLVTIDGGGWLLYISPSGCLCGAAVTTTVPVIDGDWHHAALTVTGVPAGSSPVQSLYLDGVLIATAVWAFGMGSANAILGGGGFIGSVNEVRTWSVCRTASQIGLSLALPFADLPSSLNQSNFADLSSGALMQFVSPTYAYLVSTQDAPPYDPFPDVTNRIPGFQNFGLYFSLPFSGPNVEISFQPYLVYSAKVSLRKGDALQIVFPDRDSYDDNLTGTFTVTVTQGPTGVVCPLYPIEPGANVVLTAGYTGVYRIDLIYNGLASVGVSFLTLPGPINPLLPLLVTVPTNYGTPFVPAYVDANFPETSNVVPDPRPGRSTDSVTLPAYWPPFTDTTYFPIPAGAADPLWTADDLLAAYLDLVESASSISKLEASPYGTFEDFLNLTLPAESVTSPAGLTSLLQQAYTNLTGNPAPEQPPTSFSSAYDQVYAFVLTANNYRSSIGNFLAYFQSWTQSIIDTTETQFTTIPSTIANTIYNAQVKDVVLQQKSTADFIVGLLIGSAIWGISALVVPGLGLELGAAVAGSVVAAFGANLLAGWASCYGSSDSIQSTLQNLNYKTLQDYASKEAGSSIGTVYTTAFNILINTGFQQALYSNYGLLLAARYLDPSALFDGNSVTGTANQTKAPIEAMTQASWRALVCAAFQWIVVLPDTKHLRDWLCLVAPVNRVYSISQEYEGSYGVNNLPSLPINQIFSGGGANAERLSTLLTRLTQWPQGQDNPPNPDIPFYAVSPVGIVHDANDFAPPIPYNLSAWIYYWSLKDQNGNPINPNLLQTLFGTGSQTSVNSNQPLQAAYGGWYWDVQARPGAVTYPYDAFINWATNAPEGYSPLTMYSQVPFTYMMENWADTGNDYVIFAAPACDAPAAPLVTLSSMNMEFGPTLTGSTASLPLTLTNQGTETIAVSQPVLTEPIVASITGTGFAFTMGSGFTPDSGGYTLAANATGVINVTFTSAIPGASQATLTVACQAPNSPFVVNLSAIGVLPPPSTANIIFLGDPSWWSQGVTISVFPTYQEAIANWSLPPENIVTTQLPQQGSQLCGLPYGWLAVSGNTGNGIELFMIVYFCEGVFLQLGADGAQPAAVPYGAAPPAVTMAAASIALTNVSQTVWSSGLSYAIFDFDNLDGVTTLVEALPASGNPPVGARASGVLSATASPPTDPLCPPATGLPEGWLVLYGTQSDETVPTLYMVTQYYNTLALAIQPYYSQALVYVISPTAS